MPRDRRVVLVVARVSIGQLETEPSAATEIAGYLTSGEPEILVAALIASSRG